MPVTIIPAPHPAKPVSFQRPLQDPERNLLEACLQDKYRSVDHIKDSSFQAIRNANLYASRNGFVQAAIDAYSHHHHLRLRPEDIWFAILSQLSKYINANAEFLRDKFVSHAGQRKLKIVEEASLGEFAIIMGHLIQENILDPELRDWIMPEFTTTTMTDTIVASIIMMAQLQRYFKYEFVPITCGLPSVTLLGEKKDWEKIQNRLEKLSSFGEQPTKWLSLLRPVLRRMVMSFDDPKGEEVLLFWNRIAHYAPMGSGSDSYSGWITAFCFWDDDGKILYNDFVVRHHGVENAKEFAAKSTWEKGSCALLCLDDVLYSEIETQLVPTGYASVPVSLAEHGCSVPEDCVMVAGSVGIEITDIGLQELPNVKTGSKPKKDLNRVRFTWNSFVSSLMTICQFGTPKASTSPEPKIRRMEKLPAHTTKTEVSTEDLKSIGAQKSKLVDERMEIQMRESGCKSPKAHAQAELSKSVKPDAVDSHTREPTRFTNDVGEAKLDSDKSEHIGENFPRSSAAITYDPGAGSFWAGSTVAGKQTLTAMSEPTLREEEDILERNRLKLNEPVTTPQKRMFAGRGCQEGAKGQQNTIKRPMDTVSPVVGWWMYKKKKDDVL